MIIDISQEMFSCNVYPGDPKPEQSRLQSITNGDVCNLTAFSMCAHNGTHIDAPFHFLNDGQTVDQMGLAPFVGDCYVARHEGDVTGEDAEAILYKARAAGASERILLIGNESQTVGPENAPMEVHLILLGAEIALLEGIVLTDVDEGKYFLSAAPLNLAGCDGAPCRAVLVR